MANIKTTIGNQGVVSSQVAVGGTSTLDVSIPVNLIASSGSNLSTTSTGVSHLYVSDVNGLDTNSGLSSTVPLKTFAAAVAKLPQIVKNDVVIHIGTHGGTGYTWENIDNCTLLDGASIYVYGDGAGQSGDDGFTVVLATTLAAAGSTQSVVKNTGMTIDAYMGYTIEILTGAAAGDRRTIMENTATDIIPTMKFSAAVAENDTYRIVSPAIKILLPVIASGTTTLCSNIGSPREGLTPPILAVASPQLSQHSSLFLINLTIGTVGTSYVTTNNSFVRWFGVVTTSSTIRLFTSGETAFGETSFNLAELPALLASKTSWHGWGFTSTAATALLGGGVRYGVFVGKGTLSIAEGEFHFYAGRMKTTTSSAGISVGFNGAAKPHLQLGIGSAATLSLGVKIETVSGPCITIGMATAVSNNTVSQAPLTLISTSGTGVLVDYYGVCDMYSGHSFTGGFSLTTGGWGFSVKRGGRVLVDHDTGTFVTATLGAFTLDELTSVTGNALNGANLHLVGNDGSSIVSVD